MNKARSIAAALIIGGALVLAACTNAASPADTQPPAAASAPMLGATAVPSASVTDMASADTASAPATTQPGPGDAGFVAGTAATPRVIQVTAGPYVSFSPSTVTVAKGETITFEVTAVGPMAHEFMVGPAADVAADKSGTPEASDIAPGKTKSVTYMFDGSGPYAFACHMPGHYEAGMRGTITEVG